MEKSKILLVEDEPSIADTVVYALESEGYAVTWNKTGRGAVYQIRKASPDLVILDIGLPDVSGFEIFSEGEPGAAHDERDRQPTDRPQS